MSLSLAGVQDDSLGRGRGRGLGRLGLLERLLTHLWGRGFLLATQVSQRRVSTHTHPHLQTLSHTQTCTHTPLLATQVSKRRVSTHTHTHTHTHNYTHTLTHTSAHTHMRSEVYRVTQCGNPDRNQTLPLEWRARRGEERR